MTTPTTGRAIRLLPALLVAVLLLAAASAQAADPLPGWNDGPAKSRIVGFVQAVTDASGKDYVAPADRIAVFDNDGTLWSEQPAYFQLLFAIDRVRALAPGNPRWKTQQPFKAALATARHPTLGRPYTDLVYQPMLEVLAYLRANGFRTYIVSGGGIEFVRAFSEQRYGIPAEQVIGSSIRTRYEIRDGQPAIVRLPEIDFIDDKAGKPVGIHKFIGKRPIAAFGNSDGDFEMLEWVTAGPGPRLGVLVHHDDGTREFAYDRASRIGRLSRGLDEGPKRGWTITSMKRDWKTIYPQ
jgi:phosphoserine phosphatase